MNMFSNEQLKNLQKLAEKNQDVKLLLDFYNEAQVDGEEAIRIALNQKWLEFSKTINDINIPISNSEKNEALNSLIDITKLWKGIEKTKDKVKKEDDEGKEGESFLDRGANKKRNEK
mgnify:CR=1 FL=1